MCDVSVMILAEFRQQQKSQAGPQLKLKLAQGTVISMWTLHLPDYIRFSSVQASDNNEKRKTGA